jgi:hypothetical protein
VIITSKEIQTLGLTQRWIAGHLRHLSKDYIINRYLQYEVDDIIRYCSKYKSNSKNTKQKDLSEMMIKILKDYCEQYSKQNRK